MPNNPTDIFNVSKTVAKEVSAMPERQAKIIAASEAIYYKNASDVDSGDTELAKGSSVTTEETLWIISKGTESKVFVEHLTAAEGVAPSSAVPGFYTWQPNTAESGTDTAFAEKKLFTASIFIPCNKTIKGIGYLLGGGGGTNKVIAALFNSAGTKVANTSETTEGTTAGTEKTVQSIDLTSTYAAKGPGVYFIGITANGATAKLRTIPANVAGANILTAEVSLATKNVVPASITAPTEWTAAKGPVAFVY